MTHLNAMGKLVKAQNEFCQQSRHQSAVFTIRKASGQKHVVWGPRAVSDRLEPFIAID